MEGDGREGEKGGMNHMGVKGEPDVYFKGT